MLYQNKLRKDNQWGLQKPGRLQTIFLFASYMILKFFKHVRVQLEF